MASLPGLPKNYVNAESDPLRLPMYYFPWLEAHDYHVCDVAWFGGSAPYWVQIGPISTEFGERYGGRGVAFDWAVFDAIRSMKEDKEIE